MKIFLSKKHYRHLLEALYLAHAIASDCNDKKAGVYSDVERHLCGLYKDFGAEDIVHTLDFSDMLHDERLDERMKKMMQEKHGILTTNSNLEEEVLPMLLQYEKESFFDTLVEKLVQRDMAEKYSDEQMQSLSEDEFHEKREEIGCKYEEEFSENGFKHLRLSYL